MKGLLFPGQGAQFSGMGKNVCEQSKVASKIFEEANEIIGFDIQTIMFEGTDEELKRTDVTQPALFIHSMAVFASKKDEINFDGVAGHSLGEISALCAAGVLSFADALSLVITRANAMQKACMITEGTMAAIVGMEDQEVEDICNDISDVVVTANYNCPGQLVISGSITGVNEAVKQLQEAGARRAIVLGVGGAFHSPLMAPAEEELAQKIINTNFNPSNVPVYQNVTATGLSEPQLIKDNLIKQLTSPVLWTKSMQQMIADGFDEFVEIGGNGKVLRGMMRRISREVTIEAFI